MDVVWEADGLSFKVGPFEIDLHRIIETLKDMPSDRVLAIAAMLDIIPRLAVSKGKDYGSARDTFANYQLLANAEGMPGWHQPARRLCEKAIRLANLIGQDTRAVASGEDAVTPATEDWMESMQDLVWLPAIALAMKLRDDYPLLSEVLKQTEQRATGVSGCGHLAHEAASE